MKRPTPYPGRQGEITDTGSGPCSAIAPTCAAFPEHRKSPDTEAEHVRSILQTSTSIIYYIPAREHSLSLPPIFLVHISDCCRMVRTGLFSRWPASIDHTRRDARNDGATSGPDGQPGSRPAADSTQIRNSRKLTVRSSGHPPVASRRDGVSTIETAGARRGVAFTAAHRHVPYRRTAGSGNQHR